MTANEVINTILTIALTSAVSGCIAIISRYFKNTRLIQSAMKALIRDRIVQAHDHFLEKGYITKYSLLTLEDLYKTYIALGGNSFVKELMEEIRALPIK